MARGVVPLSEAKVRRAKARERGYKLFDGGGLFLYVSPTGTKSWRMKYRSPVSGKDRTLTFGLYPDVGLADARRRRGEARRYIAVGDDPMDVRRRGAGVRHTWEDAVKGYLDHATMGKSQRTRQRRRMEIYLYPTIRRRDVAEVTRLDVVDAVTRIAAEKPETARRVLALARAVMRWAAAREWVEVNRLNDLDARMLIPASPDQHYPTLTDPAEIGGLIRAIETYPDIITRHALLWAILTASRPGNVRLAQWNQVVDDEWHIPPDEMKSGRPHWVPLSPWALDILETMRSVSDSRYIFPSPVYRDRPMSNNTLNMALQRLGYRGQIVAHGLRAMFSTVAHEHLEAHGIHSMVIEAQLSHKEPDAVKDAYNHAQYRADRVRLMVWWDKWLRSQVE